MYKYRFSIFTATYNRSKMLKKLSEMILNQTYKGEYEWIIVSDGSTDNTTEIVEEIKSQANNNVVIKYINKENGGKHTAWRVATEMFEGQYVVTCDDDDPITLDMLEIYDYWWTELEKSSDYDLFWEIRSRAQYENGKLLGQELPSPYFDSDYNEVTFKLKKGCEMASCRKVEVLRAEAAVPQNFLFEKECSNFPEGVRWSNAARKYKTRFIPNVTRTYIIAHDSLLHSKQKKKSTRKLYNNLVYALYSLNEYGDLMLKYNFKSYIRAVLYLTYCTTRVYEPVFKYINRGLDRFLFILSYIPCWVIHLFK